MSFVVIFSQLKFNDITRTSGTSNSIMFGHFINQLVKVVQRSLADYSGKWMLVIDNANIHKSLYIKEIIKDIKILIMFITNYEPSLDPVEKLIMAIKDILKIGQFMDTNYHFDSLRDVVEQLVHINFEKLINKSLGESINKMKSYLL